MKKITYLQSEFRHQSKESFDKQYKQSYIGNRSLNWPKDENEQADIVNTTAYAVQKNEIIKNI